MEQTSKLASLGELVDTVAHEVNTPIGIIQTQIDALRWNKNSDMSEELEIIKRQVSRLSSYTKNLLNYSRRLPYDPVPNDITIILEECLAFLGHRFRKKNISIEKEFKTPIPNVKFDRIQIEQVIINILNNAVDAVSNGGEIRIAAYLSDSPDYDSHTPNLIIAISNNGENIDEHNLDLIFDAFFTTKEPGKGTGLGLYISKNIVQRHKGKIYVESKKGVTTFTIIIPV